MTDATFEHFQNELYRLVRGFRENTPHIKTSEYDEASLRSEYLDPLFKALGWDIGNTEQKPLHLRDVVVEKKQSVRGRPKRVDYLFRANGIDKFVCEAKRPFANIDRFAYDAQNYAANAGVYIALLSDFEHLILYVVGARPDRNHPLPPAYGWRLHYSQFENQAEQIWNLLAKTNVLDGAIDRFLYNLPKVQPLRIKQGWLLRPERNRVLDQAFLSYLNEERVKLANGLLRENSGFSFSEDSLNLAVQRIIDRIIFQRVCEDREIDTPSSLETIHNTWLANGRRTGELWNALRTNFRDMETQFNGGIYENTYVDNLNVPETWLNDFLEELCDPASNYQFSTMPLDILGTVYEQFLCYRVDLEGALYIKEEYLKGSGVVYTPEFIVDRVIAETVRPRVQGRSPQTILNLRIVDPACGSGTFLLRAYEEICNGAIQYFIDNPEKQAATQCYIDSDGELNLTTHFKRRLLLSCIYGVDLDEQAVEVTQFSLYLKVLEGENRSTLRHQRELFPRETWLPDLSSNIKCGNALVGSDAFSSEYTKEQLSHLNPFTWDDEFPRVFANGGFHCVIGNPPYVRIQNMMEYFPEQANYIRDAYQTADTRSVDLYVPFIEKGLTLLRSDGELGYIVSNKWLSSEYGTQIRAHLARERGVSKIVHFGACQVFRDKATYTCLLFAGRSPQKTLFFERVPDLYRWARFGKSSPGSLHYDRLGAGPWHLVADTERPLFDAISKKGEKLGRIADVFVGVQTSKDAVFHVREAHSRSGYYTSPASRNGMELEPTYLRELITGEDVSEYHILYSGKYIIFPYQRGQDGRMRLVDFETIERTAPLTAAYLREHEQKLRQRERGRFDTHQWYAFGRSQNIGRQDIQKVCVPRLVDRLEAAHDSEGRYTLDNVDVCGVTPVGEYASLDLWYLTGYLNSVPIRWYFPHVSAPFQNGYWSANRQFLSEVPVVLPDLGRRDQLQAYDSIRENAQALQTEMSDLGVSVMARDRRALEGSISHRRETINANVRWLLGVSEELFESIRENSFSETAEELFTRDIRYVGPHPEDDAPVYVELSTSGAVVRHGPRYAYLTKDDDPFNVGMNRAVTLLAKES